MASTCSTVPATPDAANGMKLILHEHPGYRLARIDVKLGDALDQIKFTFDDDTEFCIGHDGGKADLRPAILTPGEHIVRVTHERFINFKCAGAAVEFETNKGRVFTYEPGLTTKWKSEQETIVALPGHEIIGLIIRRGVLKGSHQQPSLPTAMPLPAPTDTPYLIAEYRPKEDTEGQASKGDISVCDVYGRASADCEWEARKVAASAKVGRAAVMVEFKTGKVISKAGTPAAIEEATRLATEAGYIKAQGETKSVSMVDLVKKLYILLAQPGDALRMLVTSLLIGISFYLELEIKLIQGHVMTMLPAAVGNSTSSPSSDNPYVKYTCDYLLDCASPEGFTIQQATLATFMIVMLCERLAHVANVWIHHRACEAKNYALKLQAFRQTLSLDQVYYDTHSESELRGAMGDVHSINNLITWNLPYLVNLALKFVVNAAFLIQLNVKLGCMCVTGLLACYFGILHPLERLANRHSKVERKQGRLNEWIMDEAIRMITSIKMYSKEQHHIDEFTDQQGRSLKLLDRCVLLRCMREFSGGISQKAVFCVALYFGLSDASLTSAELAGFFLLVNDLLGTFEDWRHHYHILESEFGGIERFMTLMEAKPSVVGGERRVGEDFFDGCIEFKDVRFAYPSRPGEEVLKGLNLKIAPHKVTAIVGDSGAGKSTLTKLITRLYDPAQGQVLINGVDIKELELPSLHKGIAIVDQAPTLFNSSLGDNIGYGSVSGQFSDEQVKEAAELANCNFVGKFRAGFDTFAGSGGKGLSGGQKQRLAIARAAIRNPSVLILDEATSALDAENERQVTQALETIMKGRTTLVIAHRLSTVKNADDIVCMKDGAVCERGTHAELMALGGTYANLVSKQLLDDKANSEAG